ncbi:Phosphoheptose isomerase [Candidatus Thermoflexus japonica]|uniref:Phosphoheptose isomerase n=1 Tax=Candidatus Thermoflexus japonica TaxID=2035417 RepID=A0A2H5Y6D2_9CHLR|nr:Phosphoheptose isomerase [Candidatus Thermoflexus japonica]
MWAQWIEEYFDGVRRALDALPREILLQIIAQIEAAARDGRMIFLCGNGGSAATASHFACDLAKGTRRPGAPMVRAVALTDSIPLLTAWANDTEYRRVFAEQLRPLVRPGDVLIAISGSGNSPNVLEAVQVAREAGAFTIGLTGFQGGKLRDLVDLCLIVPSGCMEQIEDLHLILHHTIITVLRRTWEGAFAVAPILHEEPLPDASRFPGS